MAEMHTVVVDLRDGPLLIALHNASSPTDAAWDRYNETVTTQSARTPTGKPCRGLVLTDGGAPNAKQRASFTAIMQTYELPPLGAIVSDSAMVRGVVTALSWVVEVAKPFGPRSFTQALCHLRVADDEQDKVRHAILDGLSVIECKTARRALLK